MRMIGKMCSCPADCCTAECGKKRLDWGLLTLRLAMGIVFVFMGYGKLFGASPGIEGFTGMLMDIGVPAPVFFAYLVSIIEFFGGIAIILGFATRIFAPLLAIIMVVAFVTVKKTLPGGNIDLTLFSMAVALTLIGPGGLSLMKDGCGDKSDGEDKQETPKVE